ncbi:hypothetical protein [Gluconobacter sp. P5B12]|uniref:hypothetical protein n=1 Tax=unclassified Gluconobacter TaxID=2644261 RepID=UPI001C05001A|nr:hypothetical protein [Gluconobacter sp. P5B12]
MTLSELIDFLEKQDQSKVIASGWGEGSAHSYRGYYECIAFTPKVNVTIAEMLAEANSAIGQTFEGYKGGNFVMGPHTDCYLAEYGSCGSELSLPLLEVMCGVGPMIERAIAEAVAAERERNIGACNKVEEGYVRARMGDCVTASHRCAEAIRSAAK